jgi:hypothetical protein
MRMNRAAARVVVGLVLAAVGLMPLAGSAEAVKRVVYTKGAVVSLVETGAMTGAPGNMHYGHLEFYRSSDGSVAVYGYIFHFDCPSAFSVDPTDDFDAAASQIEAGCFFYTDGSESLESGEVDISMTGDQTWTRVSGYFDSSLAGQGQVAFNLRLHGSGPITETSSVSRGPGYKQLFRDRARAASARGDIGGLSIGDDLRFAAQTVRKRFIEFTW